MALQSAFRLSFYVTLALACTCLAAAELFFLDWIWSGLVVIVIFIAVAYRVEGRWELSLEAANQVGLLIGIGVVGWLYFNVPRSQAELVAGGVPWPAGLLPPLGPLLVVLLLVKLFRPKQIRDFWFLQTIGLMVATLGCVLAGDPLFGVLLVVYVASFIWCLALFYIVREQAMMQSTTPEATPEAAPLFPALANSARTPWRLAGAGRVTQWTVCVVVVGSLVYLTAPRQGDSPWLPHQLMNSTASLKSGNESSIDLNRTGKVELSEEPVFEVFAHKRGGVMFALPDEMYWIVETLDCYDRGAWLETERGFYLRDLAFSSSPINKPDLGAGGIPHPKEPPADLAEGSIYFMFQVPFQQSFLRPLAFPVGKDAHIAIRPYGQTKPSRYSFFQRIDGADALVPTRVRSPVFFYGQIMEPRQDPDISSAEYFTLRHRKYIMDQKVPGPLVEWMQTVMKRVPGLEAEERRLDDQGRVPPENQRRVARALSDYLASSGEFSYSLNLTRRQVHRDPTVDFLLNVKEGHCVRFAGGLALMLRAVGIPSRIINGYKGQESVEPGHFLIRQNRAHSWVQALITQKDSDGWQWLTLDPTPGTDSTETGIFAVMEWFMKSISEGRLLWRTFIVEFNAEQQEKSVRAIWEMITSEDYAVERRIVIGTVLGALVFWFPVRSGWRSLRRARAARRHAPDSLQAQGLGWYVGLLRVLKEHLGIGPELGQTPREFGRIATDRLAERALAKDARHVPDELVELLYRARFGGQTLSAQQTQSAENGVAILARVLSEKQA